MNVTNKEPSNYSSRNMCRNHNIKADRDVFRTCPSKLSKRELEDLYFALLDNNLELKRTINTLQDNNKLLNTKVHRMTAVQKTNIGKEKDCCATTQALVQEQRDAIADLNRANERMSERIRVQNMRLCSAKQFLRRSPSQTTSRGIKALTAPPASLKNSTVSMLNTKESPKIMSAIQYIPLEKEALSTRTVDTEISDQEKESSVRECNENKCRTLMEELKQKIVGLQEELTNCHKEYSSRISRLEGELTNLQNAKEKALAASSHGLLQRSQRADMLADKLRTATSHCNDLEAQLLIERRKVAEMETRLRATDISIQMVKTIENRLAVVDGDKKSPKKDKMSPPKEPLSPGPNLSSSSPSIWDESSPKPAAGRGPGAGSEAKHSDDSGYADSTRTVDLDNFKALGKVNEELVKKIIDLQKQLDALRVANAGKTKSEPTLNNMNEYPKPIEETEMDSPNQVLRQDCKPSTSNAASPEKGGVIQKCHSEKKTQELNEANKLWESYYLPLEKKVLEETGPQTKTEEKIHFTIDEVMPEREKDTSEKRKSVTKTDHSNHEIHGASPVNISEDKPKEKHTAKGKKSSYEKIRDVINTKLRHTKSSQGSKSNNVPYDDEIRSTERFEKIPVEFRNDDTLDDVAKSNLKVNPLEGINKGVALKGKENDAHDAGNMASTADKIKEENNQNSGEFSTTTFVYDGRELNAPVNEEGVNNQPLGVQTDRPPSASECHTYTIQNAGAASRVNSPDNTDQEISSITDLPSEGDGKSPRAALSPGEDKATTTYTESYTETYTGHTNHGTEAGSLSEGELPIRYAGRRSTTECRERAKSTSTETKPVPVAQKMEAALQSIGEELARCRQLLESQRPQEGCESPTKEASMMHRSSIAVHRSSANPHIGGVTSPKCVFTLHIGTLVMSDEAVLSSRDKSLLLTWKFYDQNVAMTGVRPGSVVLFDFSTEYDVTVDDKFLDYLKYGEMPIIICEQYKQDQPFASCVLPFRDTLINTNRRVDMSLALVAGPGMGRAHGAADAVDSGNEIGVLDLWCMLRVPLTSIPAINRCVAMPFFDQPRSSQITKEKPTKAIIPVVDEDQTHVYRSSDHELLKKSGELQVPKTMDPSKKEQ